MMHNIVVAVLLFFAFGVFAEAAMENYKVDPDTPDAIITDSDSNVTDAGWFTRDRFGMFICWGIAVTPLSTWTELDIVDPATTYGDPSWWFNRSRIPVEKWRRLATRFNPRNYDPESWVKLAKSAGMKYIIFTAKHHDGFAMYDSPCSKFDVVDATPFKRDVVKDLAAACRKHGIRLCIYYSQAQDWEDPNGGNNDWAYDQSKKDFNIYLQNKCKPQVRELLTQYGPIGFFWFDTPAEITPAQCKELQDFVKSIQPDCLINSRIGHGYGDYMSMGDSQFPDVVIEGLWETASTSSSHWYWHPDDKPRMTSEQVVRYLVGNVSRGGNLALNFGPDYNGLIPNYSVEMLGGVGKWMSANNESVYECGRTPYVGPMEWGTITTRPGFMYLHIFNWPKNELTLYGIENNVYRVSLLESDESLAFEKSTLADNGLTVLKIKLPTTAPNAIDTVIKVKIDGIAKIQNAIVPQNGDLIKLEASVLGGGMGRHGFSSKAKRFDFARVNSRDIKTLGMHLSDFGAGYLMDWVSKDETIQWDFKTAKPGKYDVYIITSKAWSPNKPGAKYKWEDGQKIRLELCGTKLEAVIKDENSKKYPVTLIENLDKVTRLGSVDIAKPGNFTASLSILDIPADQQVGVTLRSIVMMPAK